MSMMDNRISRIAGAVGLAVLALAGGRLAAPVLAEEASASAMRSWQGPIRKADTSASSDGFQPARCATPVPAELLVLADWPLDADGRTCLAPAVPIELAPILRVERVEDPPAVVRLGLPPDPLERILAPIGQVEDVAPPLPVVRVDLVADASRPAKPERPPVVELAAVAEDELAELRGGFELPNGLLVSFGIERMVFINGVLASSTSLNVVEMGRLVEAVAGGQPAVGSSVGVIRSGPTDDTVAVDPTAAAVAVAQPAVDSSVGAAVEKPVEAVPPAQSAVGTSIGVIQNGPNNMAVELLRSGTLAQVIQNSLNDQRLQAVTTISARINAMQMLRAQRLQESLDRALRLQ